VCTRTKIRGGGGRPITDSSVLRKLTPKPAEGEAIARNKLTHAAELWKGSRITENSYL
jgi:hypothetical protein